MKNLIKILGSTQPYPDKVFVEVQHTLNGLPENTVLQTTKDKLRTEVKKWKVVSRLLSNYEVGYCQQFDNETINMRHAKMSVENLEKARKNSLKRKKDNIYRYTLAYIDNNTEKPEAGEMLEVIYPDV